MNKILCALLALLIPLAAICADKHVSDDELFDQVRRRLANDVEVKGGTLDVDVKDGVVTVRGILESDKLKARAEKLVNKVHGVKKVVNEIRVAPIRSRPQQ